MQTAGKDYVVRIQRSYPVRSNIDGLSNIGVIEVVAAMLLCSVCGRQSEVRLMKTFRLG